MVKLNKLALGFILLATAILVLPWHFFNNQIPIWDAAAFVLNAQKISSEITQKWPLGLIDLYTIRGWRPIIFPALVTPIFILFDNNIIISVAVSQYLFASTIAIYIFKLISQYCSTVDTIVSTLLIISTSWLIGYTNVFYSELAWLAFLSGLLFHLHQALEYKSKFQYIISGFFFGIAVNIRPIESLILLALPTVIILTRQIIEKKLKLNSVFFYIIQLLNLIIFLSIIIKFGFNSYTVVYGIFSFLISIYVLIITYKNNNGILLTIFLAQFIALIWNIYSIQELFYWAYDTSFGSLAKISDQKFKGISPWGVIESLFSLYSPFTISILLILLPISSISWPINKQQKLGLTLVFFSFLMLAPIVISLSVTGTSDMRRIMPAVLLLEIGAILVILNNKLKFYLPSRIVLTLLMVFQFINIVNNEFQINKLSQKNIFGLVGNLRVPSGEVDPNDLVLKGLTDLGIKKGNIAAYTYCYRDYENCNNIHFPMFEPVALATLAKQEKKPIEVQFIGDLNLNDRPGISNQVVARGYKYILIDMFNNPIYRNQADSYMVHTEFFINAINENDYQGFKKIGCFNNIKRDICVLEIVE